MRPHLFRLADSRALRQRDTMRARLTSCLVRRLLAVMLAGIATCIVVAPQPLSAEIPSIASRQRAEKKSFTDSEILDGFFKTAFGAEFHLAGRVDRIRKYDVPVRIFVDGNRPDRQGQL